MTADPFKQIRLRDGRLLGFSEFGSEQGDPVLYFHGFPGSRLEARLVHRQAVLAGARIIAVDRPGYGASDFQPGRLIHQWPEDVEQLADALGLKSFCVLGVSGGGPYAAACAWKLPRRLERAGIVCGLAPLTPELMPRLGRRAFRYRLLRSLPKGALQPLMPLVRWAAARHPDQLLSLLAHTLPLADRNQLSNPSVRETLCDSMREAFRQGHRGPFMDLRLYAQPWGFNLGDIEAEVKIWHGELDSTVPVSMGRYLAENIPRSVATYPPQEGHFSLPIAKAESILGDLLK